jgi:ABC-type multidrug transport system fused ATPase/permease subunit
MIQPSSGTITIDGLDISMMSRHYVRSRLNAIAQDAFFLSGSVRLNLDHYETATTQEATEALKKVQLWAAVEAKGGLYADLNLDMLSTARDSCFASQELS